MILKKNDLKDIGNKLIKKYFHYPLEEVFSQVDDKIYYQVSQELREGVQFIVQVYDKINNHDSSRKRFKKSSDSRL